MLTPDISKLIAAITDGANSRDDIEPLYVAHVQGSEALARIDALLDAAETTQNNDLHQMAAFFLSHHQSQHLRKQADRYKRLLSQDWSDHVEDHVGWFQGHGQPQDIPFLEQVAWDSLTTSDDRCDYNQQMFRKCTWAIGEIDRRDFQSNRGFDVLLKMATNAHPLVAYWAKKQINGTMPWASPYKDEDLSMVPDPPDE